MIIQEILVTAIEIIIGVSLFFVWVIRYDNIKSEFIEYNYPDWFRDFIGILKFIFFLFILTSHGELRVIGAAGIAILMIGAVFTHLRVKHAFYKSLPSLTLMGLSSTILLLALN